MIIGTTGQPDGYDDYPDLTRVEVIDHRRTVIAPAGTVRRFTADRRTDPPFLVSVSVQDSGRTLKIFLSDPG
jgi:hypothetical protein